MTEEEEDNFLHNVQQTIKNNPQLLSRTIMACSSGSELALSKITKQAMDMETIAVAMHSTMNERYKKSTHKWIDRLVQSKIEPYLTTGWTANLKSLIK